MRSETSLATMTAVQKSDPIVRHSYRREERNKIVPLVGLVEFNKGAKFILGYAPPGNNTIVLKIRRTLQ
ncbi:MAG: hypothetical protein P1V97_24990 [Planctomycetota bacterium]|nr:hypothetical protein [Planctomycetota bacterium]